MPQGLTRVVVLAMVTIGAIVVLFAVGSRYVRNRASLFSGDGRISDDGFWTYPRYTVSFPHINVASDTPFVFAAKGLPGAPMTVAFNVIGPESSSATRARAVPMDRTLSVRIRDDTGHELYGVSAPMSEWVLAQSVNEAYLWHRSLRDLPLKTGQAYSIEIRFTGAKGADTDLLLEPELSGGGNELP